MKPIWFVEPGNLEWSINCRFEIGGKIGVLQEVISFDSHRRATVKNAHIASIIQFMAARRDRFIAEEAS